jgi:hypothetical protein
MLEQKIAQGPDSTMFNQAPEITMPRFGPRKLALSGWHYRADAASATGEPGACCVQQLNARPVARACPSLGSKPITTLSAIRREDEA